ncbi:MAG: prolipoprotein diacylglyceryl transferase [Phycisphaeraceae bacterium]|nr:prolipoprotein diacylglyceryl transferase [Phycisphaeraceae bacterium]MCB9847827.1 prolipoprotein diacylglyceryl transferase [Phycisphaeraceae bacterium]
MPIDPLAPRFPTTLAAWLHDIDPFVFRITDTLGPRWYGTAYIIGFLAAWWMFRALARRGRTPLEPVQAFDLVFTIAIGVLLGGRLGYVLIYQPSLLTEFSSRAPWWGVLRINQGGMASHGGMVGVILACAWFARKTKIPALHLLDLVALAAPIGLFLGRLANFVNGELLGRIVANPGEPSPWWSVKFPQEILTLHPTGRTAAQDELLVRLLEAHQLATESDLGPAAQRVVEGVQRGDRSIIEQIEPLLSARVPSQLIQALAEGIVLFVALWLIWSKPRKPGVIGAWFLILYGVGRIITEIWRLPDDHLLDPRPLGMSRGQWLSALMVLIGVAALLFVQRRAVERIGGWRKRA